jgi:hypothetical protein
MYHSTAYAIIFPSSECFSFPITARRWLHRSGLLSSLICAGRRMRQWRVVHTHILLDSIIVRATRNEINSIQIQQIFNIYVQLDLYIVDVITARMWTAPVGMCILAIHGMCKCRRRVGVDHPVGVPDSVPAVPAKGSENMSRCCTVGNDSVTEF